MRKNWSNVDVDLKLFSSHIQKFFDERGFLTSVEGDSLRGFVVKAEASEMYEIDGCVRVSVNADSTGLVVSFDFDKKKSSLCGVSPIVMSLFGAGIFFVRSLKSGEDRARLERDFWRFVDNVLYSALKSL